MGVRRPFVIVLASLLLAPIAFASEASEDPRCVNLRADLVGQGLIYALVLSDAVGVALGADDPGNGLYLSAVIYPSICDLPGELDPINTVSHGVPSDAPSGPEPVAPALP